MDYLAKHWGERKLAEKYVDVNGIKTYYRVVGLGQPIILVHGLGANWEMWGKTIPYLQKNFQVFALDLPGCGLSDKPEAAYDINFFTDFLIDLIAALGLANVILIGESMGGQAAVKVVGKRPELVDKLVLVASSGLSPMFHGIFKIPGLAWLFTFVAGRWEKFNLWFYRKFYADKHYVSVGVVQEYLQRLQETGAKEAYYRTIMGVRSAEKDLLAQLKKITTPTLVVWGHDDQIMPLRDAYIFAENIAQSKLVILPDCGHVPPVEKYREFNKAVLDFIKIY